MESCMIGDNHVQFGGGRSAERRSRPTLLFFMVKKNDIFNSILSGFYLSDCDFYSAIIDSDSKEKISKVNSNNNGNITIGNNNNNNDNKNLKDSKHKYVKILVNDPFNNRDIILKVTKKQKGVILIWSLLDLCSLLLFIVFMLSLVVNSLFFLDFLADMLTFSSPLSLQCAAIPLFVYNNAEMQRKEIIKDNSNRSTARGIQPGSRVDLVFIVELIKLMVNVM